jgi:preprotein translocase subunit SecF
LITSITTLIAVISLFVLGPSTINTFSFTLIIGVMIGTYSSIFIASAVLLEWSNFRHKHIENKSNA